MVNKRAEREIPYEWRESVARQLAAWVETQPRNRRTSRALAPLLGISGFTYTKLKNKEGPLGLHVLVSLRRALKISIDQLIGLDATEPIGRPLPTETPGTPETLEAMVNLIRSDVGILRSELTEMRREEARLPIRRKNFPG